jgi:hypothetical protein
MLLNPKAIYLLVPKFEEFHKTLVNLKAFDMCAYILNCVDLMAFNILKALFGENGRVVLVFVAVLL